MAAPARSGTARSPSGSSPCPSSSTRPSSPRASTSTRCTSRTGRGSSTARSAPRRTSRSQATRSCKGFEVRSAALRRPRQGGDRRRAGGTRGRIIDVEHFVPRDQIDPVFFAKSYFLGARDEGEDAFRLLRDALEEPGARDRPLGRSTSASGGGGPRARGRARACTRCASPTRSSSPRTWTCRARRRTRPKRELEMAKKLVKSLSEEFKPGRLQGHLPRGGAEGHRAQEGQGRGDRAARGASPRRRPTTSPPRWRRASA